jgi:tRNA pseudouridine55 synthase
VAKKAGPTSHDIVDMARRALRERRIGHTGTLDPLAEGLLLLCVGQATRLQQYLLRWDKHYEGEIRLGSATTTYDSEGEPTDPRGVPPRLDGPVLERLEHRFRGEIEQVPPPYSAKKIAGKKLYELARSGENVSPGAKTVRVEDLTLRASSPDVISVQATTSTGFYVRSLAHDIGLELGCGGYLEHLHRTSIGPYNVANALAQDDLEAATEASSVIDCGSWISIDTVALPFPGVELNPAAANRFVHGQDVVVLTPGLDGVSAEDTVVVRGPGSHLLGVGTVRAVLARGRTLNIAPAMVLETAAASSATRK